MIGTVLVINYISFIVYFLEAVAEGLVIVNEVSRSTIKKRKLAEMLSEVLAKVS
jgi:hypothetical protein